MNSIKISTTQNIELEFEPASVGERIVAWLIDLVIFIAYFFVIGISLTSISQIDGFISDNPWIAFLIFSPFIFYNLLCEVFLNGQSIGKRVMNIKVISLNGERATFGQYLIRWLFRLVDIYLFYGLPAFVSILVSEKKQRIGDLVAGTTLIRTKPRASFQQTIFVPTEQVDYQVTFPEVATLSDKDMQLVKEVMITVRKTGNTMLAYHAAERIRKILNVESQLEPVPFLQLVLADYNYLTSQT
jgi:uncharacterized RDD family membrane protein YckC